MDEDSPRSETISKVLNRPLWRLLATSGTTLLQYKPKMLQRRLTLYGHIKTAEQWDDYTEIVIGKLAVDGWAVTFGTVR